MLSRRIEATKLIFITGKFIGILTTLSAILHTIVDPRAIFVDKESVGKE